MHGGVLTLSLVSVCVTVLKAVQGVCIRSG